MNQKIKKFTIGLIGNPNCGKTTLFNVLTGSNQRVGNWPGVTVDCKSGFFEQEGYHVEIVDLPGIYSLSVTSDESAIDERISADYLISNNADLIVNVLDANNLERNLYLTTQLLELNTPVILAVNMLDIAKKHGITIDLKKLASAFNCPTIGLVSSKKQGIDDLKNLIIKTHNNKNTNRSLLYPEKIQSAINSLTKAINQPQSHFLAIRLLEDDLLARKKVSEQLIKLAEQQKQLVAQHCEEDIDILIADNRYGKIHKITEHAVTKSSNVKTTVTQAIDNIVLNRILGIPIFLAIMYLMFFFSIKIGGIFQDFFQISSNAIFVHGLADILTRLHLPIRLTNILTSGIG